MVQLNVEIKLAHTEEKITMTHLLQLYMYDFTEYTDAAVNSSGLYSQLTDWENYWQESDAYFPYIVTVNDEIAGFALTKKVNQNDRHYNLLAHFFIMRKYRRSGVGKQAAKLVIQKHSGEWELYQLERNVPAQDFWTNVIGELTNGNFVERHENGRRFQTFKQDR
ncbi:GNAT family N-acetyltransferase [Paenibacillus sp. 2TAB26]|uniref:GNAT family N-acetyltransferase n=1 Tax=Paenibacillus sp. 2TAB26 TaxID=3233005 RepID=UPI003F9BD15E